MAELPVRKLPGVGKVNAMILGGLEIFTYRDLLNKAAEIYINFTEKHSLVRKPINIILSIHLPLLRLRRFSAELHCINSRGMPISRVKHWNVKIT